MRWFSILLFSFLVTACGGGGTIDKTDNNTGGGTSDDYQLTLSILESTNELSLSTPLTIEAVFKNDGVAVANTRVDFTTDVYARFDGANSVLTNSEGKATVTLMPTDQKGAGAVKASISLSESTLEESIDYSSLGDGGLRLNTSVIDSDGNEISSDNPLSQLTIGLVKAELKFDGNPISGEAIAFQLDELAFTNSNARVETDSQGIAFLSIEATKEIGTGEIIVSYQDKQVNTPYVSVGNPYFGELIYELSINQVSNDGNQTNNLSVATPITLEATLTLNGLPQQNKELTFSSNDKGKLVNSVLKTDSTGKVLTTLKATNQSATNEPGNEGLVTVSFNNDGSNIVKTYKFTSTGDGGYKFQVSIKDLDGQLITQQNPLSASKQAIVEVLLLEDLQPKSGAVVSIDQLEFGNVVGSRSETNENGIVTFELKPIAPSQANAMDLGQLTVNLLENGFTLIPTPVNFYTKGDPYFGVNEYTLSLSMTGIDGNESNALSLANPLSVVATLKLNGNPVPNAEVQFTVNELADLGAILVKTNEFGVAQTSLKDNGESSTDEDLGLISASFESPNGTVSAQKRFEAKGDGGVKLSISVVDENRNLISETNPLSADKSAVVVVTATENLQPKIGTLITISPGTFGVVDSVSRTTDANGQAEFKLTPTKEVGLGTGEVTEQASGKSNSFTYFSNGDPYFGEQIYEVSLTLTDQASGALSRSLSNSTPLVATATLMLNNKPIANELIDFTVENARLEALDGNGSFSSVSTNENGIARVLVLDRGDSGSGTLTANFASQNVTGTATFEAVGDGGESFSLAIDIVDSNGTAISESNPIGENKDALITLTLKEGDTPLEKKFLTVDVGSKGVTVPRDGRVVTNANGQATITLQANTETGAEAITVTYSQTDQEDVVATKPYYTDGNANFNADPYKFVFVAKDKNTQQLSNQLTGTTPLTLEAQLLFNNSPVTNTRVQFSVDQFAVLDHSSGSILTNSNGIATVDLLDNDLGGAGRASVTFEKEGENLVATLDFNSAGTGGVSLNVSQVVDESGNPITSDNPVSATTNGFVTVTLTENNQPINNALILVQGDEIATTRPSNGKIATDVNGQATFELVPTTEAGLGEFTVTYQQTDNLSFTKTAFFHSSGNPRVVTSTYDIDVRILTGCNADWDANRNTVELNPDDPNTGCSDSSRISSNELAEVFVKLSSKSSGTSLPREIVNVATTIGQILPSSGTALTDEFGVALLKLQPGDSGGAGTVSATFDSETSSSNFSVGVVDLVITLDNGLNDGVTQLNAGGSTVITATLRDEEGNLYLTPADVNFSSVCAANGEAQLDAQVKSSNGEATATYRANGCSITDTITATVEAGGNNFVNSIELTVSESPAQALKFITTNENFEQFIALPPGEGGAPTLSVVEFQLLDEDTNPIKQKRIDFRLTDSIGAASLTQSTSSTDNEGKAQTTVTSGLVPGPLVVQACYIPDNLIDQVEGTNQQVTCWPDEFDRCNVDPRPDDCPAGGYVLVPISEQITGVSSRILLSSGVTDQDSFDAAPETLNLNSLSHIGATVDINIYFGDQFNQLSGDGVTATVQSETGVVGTFDGEQFNELYNCQSTDATCTLTWRNQGDAPFSGSEWQNTVADVCDTYFGSAAPCIGTYPTTKDGRNIIRGGRVSFLVTAKGQETFVDKPGANNRNGRFDEGEYHSAFDLPEAFLDINDNGSFDAKTCLEGDADDPCVPANSDGGHNEIFRDINNNGIYDGADGIYNGLLCSEEAQKAGACSRELIEVRKQFSIVMSDDTPHVRFAVPVSYGRDTGETDVNGNTVYSCTDTNGNELAINNLILEESGNENFCDIRQVTLGSSGVTGVIVYIFYSDINGNPLPAGTEIEISTNNGKLDIDKIDEVVPNEFGNETSFAQVRLSAEDEPNSRTTGTLSIQFTFTKPDGTTQVLSQTLSVNDES